MIEIDWTPIITSAISLVAGGGAMKLFTLNSSKRKAKAEAKSVEVENFQSVIRTLNDQLDRCNLTIKEKDAALVDKEAEKSKYLMRLQSLYDDMCIHKGCKLRKPHQGMGGAWYEAHADDPNLGCDFLSVETLLRQWRKRKKEEESTNNDNDE